MFDSPVRLIRGGKLELDNWRHFDADIHPIPPDGTHWIVKLELWKQHINEFNLAKAPIAILISADSDLSNLPTETFHSDLLPAIEFIAIDFPIYTDGRGYSLAQILRNKFGWKGEIRAVGDVMIDTIHYLARCGFDSFLVKPGHDPKLALEAFETFTVHYQRSYLKPSIAPK